MRFSFLSVAVTGVLAAATSLQAASIGVQFAQSGTALAPTDSAGVVSVPQFNVITGGASGSATALHDSTPSATTLNITYSSSYTYSGPGNGTGSNQSLTSGGLSTNRPYQPITVALSNVPYASYDLYVYTSSNGNNNSNSYFTSAISDGTTTYYGYAPNGTFPGFQQITSTNSASGTQGNYVKFAGETASNLTFSLTPQNNGGVNINGFEIVATPEPASLALVGVSAMGLLRRRRGNRA